MVDLLQNLSIITTIPKKDLERLVTKSEDIICHEVLNSVYDDGYIQLNIGIGTINIHVSGDDLQYKYIPSNQLEDKLKESIYSNESPLTISVEQELKNKMLRAYKELF